MDANIISVVVTYNRKELLCECLDAILSQSRPVSKVIVVNNASTDGTLDLLAERGFVDNLKIEILNLPKNVGGAGGFYAGMSRAKEIGEYDGVWIMDDDTMPSTTCLEELLKAESILKGQYSFLASSVYGLNGEYMNVPTVDTREGANGYVEWYQYLKEGLVAVKEATFVSLLISKRAIEKCGLPCKDFFIWGDDSEYTTRLTRYCDKAYMVGGSVAIHKRKGGNELCLATETNLNRVKLYLYHIRNSGITTRYYCGFKPWTRFALHQCSNAIKLGLRFRWRKSFIIISGVWQSFVQYLQFHNFIQGELGKRHE